MLHLNLFCLPLKYVNKLFRPKLDMYAKLTPVNLGHHLLRIDPGNVFNAVM